LSSNPDTNRRWVQVAHVWRPRGNKGEVVAELLTDFPERFSSLKYVYLAKGSGEPQSRGLRRFWIDRNHAGQGIFHFEDSANISDAEELRGYDVFLPWEERAELSKGQYFVTDLIGCTVFEIPASETKLASPPCDAEEAPLVLGTVRNVYFPGEGLAGTPLLEVETASGELLVPLAEDICTRIDVAARRIDVTLPEGLKNLNAPG
jgi:16S rRNA processing protein RimM